MPSFAQLNSQVGQILIRKISSHTLISVETKLISIWILFGNSKGPNELLDTFKIPTPGSCCMSYPVIICDILVFNDNSN